MHIPALYLDDFFHYISSVLHVVDHRAIVESSLIEDLSLSLLLLTDHCRRRLLAGRLLLTCPLRYLACLLVVDT